MDQIAAAAGVPSPGRSPVMWGRRVQAMAATVPRCWQNDGASRARPTSRRWRI